MHIRKAIKKDVLHLSKLFQQEIEYHQCLAGYYELLPNFAWVAYTEEKLKDHNGVVLVAEYNESLAGFIYIRTIDYRLTNRYKSILQRIRSNFKKRTSFPIKPLRWGVIEECYVIPSLRRQGIGSQLVFSAMKWFQSKKIGRIELSYVTKNKEGEAFWRKFGFEIFRLSLSKDL